MKSVLLLSPTSRERERVPKVAAELGLNVIFDDFDEDYFDNFLGKSPDFSQPVLDLVGLIDNTVEKYRNANLSGVTSAVGYPGMSAASVIADKLGLPGPPVEAVMLCEHKYYSRIYQKQHVPDATPEFHLLDPHDGSTLSGALGFPSFLKPVKGCMSRNAFKVEDEKELGERVKTSLLPQRFIDPYNDMLRAYTRYPRDASCLLQETLLHGVQVSLEGYVYRGRVTVQGIIDAIMYPGSFSFKRFQYPSALPHTVQERMVDIATRFFSGIGYDDAPFNMELSYDTATDRIAIIEINPKIASQFPSMFEKVDGYSTYRTLLEVATGRQPTTRVRQGKHKLAASCVLRTFQDQKVLNIPTAEEKAGVLKRFPDTQIQVYAKPGKRLSDEVQDAYSFRYGLVDLGAENESDLEQKLAVCKRMLTFGFEPVGRTRASPRDAPGFVETNRSAAA